ncbi:Autophagy protein 5 [Nymphaea thermarum]|nr:Autophagy protein 5 [Nymphaea thermarum]
MDCREAQDYVWEGAIPLQIHLHESEVATLPVPSPALVLGPRNGYLPLLLPLVKPHFSNSLPPGDDNIWFDYKGLPLKWYVPLGVLFDLLCAVPERPWNLTVHFRGYPQELFSPCEGEENVKHSFMNSLKEAAYIINGNSKVIMNMSQFDQAELWRCVLKGEIEGYLQVSSKLKLGAVGEWCTLRSVTSSEEPRQSSGESTSRSRIGTMLGKWRSSGPNTMNVCVVGWNSPGGYVSVELVRHPTGQLQYGVVEWSTSSRGREQKVVSRCFEAIDLRMERPGSVVMQSYNAAQRSALDVREVRNVEGRVPVRLYLRMVDLPIDDLEDLPAVGSWEEISYMNKPVEIQKYEGEYFSLRDMVDSLLPGLFSGQACIDDQELSSESGNELRVDDADLNLESGSASHSKGEVGEEISSRSSSGRQMGKKAKIELIRIQGIEPKLDLPFAWAYHNLMHPDHFLHVCLYISGTDGPQS